MAILFLVNLHYIKTYIHFFFQNVNFFFATFGFHSVHRLIISEEKKGEIWLSPMTKIPTPAEMSKEQSDNTNNARKKVDYTAFLRTDLGRSVGVTTATQLVWLTWCTGPTFPIPATAV